MIQTYLLDTPWVEIKDGDPSGMSIFKRHYSYRQYADGREQKLFVGPGQKMVLLTPDGSALFVWRKYKSDDGQTGVNCAVFRNEGLNKSSDLILAAEKRAHERWRNERLFTYVNPRKIKSKNPGYCFLQAGWKRCGLTKRNRLVILEKLPKALEGIEKAR